MMTCLIDHVCQNCGETYRCRGMEGGWKSDHICRVITEDAPPPPNNVLDAGYLLIHGSREQTYGHPKENLKRIARLWNAYLDNREGALLPKDVAMMMVLLKMARLCVTSMPIRDQRDSVVDMAGYVGLVERVEE